MKDPKDMTEKESVATTDALRSAVRRYRALLQEIQKSP